MIWTGIAVTLVAWFIGLLLQLGPLVNLLLVVAADLADRLLPRDLPPVLLAIEEMG